MVTLHSAPTVPQSSARHQTSPSRQEHHRRRPSRRMHITKLTHDVPIRPIITHRKIRLRTCIRRVREPSRTVLDGAAHALRRRPQDLREVAPEREVAEVRVVVAVRLREAGEPLVVLVVDHARDLRAGVPGGDDLAVAAAVDGAVGR